MKILILITCWLVFGSASATLPIFADKDQLKTPPNIIRTCCAFGIDLSVARIPFLKKTDIIDLSEIGEHKYLGGEEEQNGIIYTKRGGFIDLGHLRDYADWTAYLYQLIEENKKAKEVLVIKLGHEGGAKTLSIDLRNELTQEQHFELAAHIAYNLSLWHEIATWYGSSYIPMVHETYSSFSPEDLYSNLLGIKLGIEAIKSELPFEEAMTILLSEKLKELDAVESSTHTYEAMMQVEGKWWTQEKALPNGKILIKRFFDKPKEIYPWLVDEESIGSKLIKPDEDMNRLYVFKIETGLKVPAKEINDTNVITQLDFEALISRIKAEDEIINTKSIYKKDKMEARKIKKLAKG